MFKKLIWVGAVVWLVFIYAITHAKIYTDQPVNVVVSAYRTYGNDIVLTNVHIEWEQINNATQTCISKTSGRYGVDFACIPTKQGLNVFDTMHYVDGAYKHNEGDVYHLTTMNGTDVLGTSSYTATYNYRLPLFNKE